MYTWPTKLLVPSRPPKLVYLDLNHWVALSKADASHPGGEPFKAVLVFPISDASGHEKVPTMATRKSSPPYRRASRSCGR